MDRKRALDQLVVSQDQIVANAVRLDSMRGGTTEERRFHAGRVKNGKVFIAVGTPNGWIFAPSKFCGYRENDLHHLDLLDERHGGDTNKRITSLLGEPVRHGEQSYDDLLNEYHRYCDSCGIEPSRHHQPPRFWIVNDDSLYLEESNAKSEIWEGALKRVTVNRYERDQQARQDCLDHFGYDCTVCGVNFEERYGDLGADFIHVHHLVPIATIGESYIIDPVEDLIPVCPNCHAILHRGRLVLHPDELRKKMLETANSKK